MEFESREGPGSSEKLRPGLGIPAKISVFAWGVDVCREVRMKSPGGLKPSCWLKWEGEAHGGAS